MEEKRKNIGMEILPSLHKRLKVFAAENDMPLWAGTQEAIETYLSKQSTTQVALRHYSENHRALHDTLEKIVALEGEDFIGLLLDRCLRSARPHATRKQKKGRMGVMDRREA